MPICKIPVGAANVLIREQLLTVFENILLEQLNIKGQMVSVIKYLISEAMDNIVEHGNVRNGWIMVQNYRTKGFLDICIFRTTDLMGFKMRLTRMVSVTILLKHI